MMTFEHLSGFSSSNKQAPHYTSTRIPYGRWSFALTRSLALPTPFFPLMVTRRHGPNSSKGKHALSSFRGITSGIVR